MVPSFLALSMQTALLAFEAQQVIALRLWRIAAGGAEANREMARMVTEKADAAARVAMAAGFSAARGMSAETIARNTVGGYRTRVRRNRRRLLRRT